jgi:hypothetical protein
MRPRPSPVMPKQQDLWFEAQKSERRGRIVVQLSPILFAIGVASVIVMLTHAPLAATVAAVRQQAYQVFSPGKPVPPK